jgi:hemerythrin-like domain-containing protein
MNPIQRESMADVRDMYMAHIMLRREFSQLPELIRNVTEGDTRRASIVGAHVDLLCRTLHMHHEGEDLLLWPRLAQRGGAEAAAIVPVMEAQHHAIEEANEQVAKVLPGWRSSGRGGDELADIFEWLLPTLVEHMTMEEKEILPLAEKYVTASEWKELGGHGMSEFPKKYLPVTFGMMMYEGDPAVIKTVLADAPLPARLLMPIIGPRLFAAHAKRVHGTATPPRVMV